MSWGGGQKVLQGMYRVSLHLKLSTLHRLWFGGGTIKLTHSPTRESGYIMKATIDTQNIRLSPFFLNPDSYDSGDFTKSPWWLRCRLIHSRYSNPVTVTGAETCFIYSNLTSLHDVVI